MRRSVAASERSRDRTGFRAIRIRRSKTSKAADCHSLQLVLEHDRLGNTRGVRGRAERGRTKRPAARGHSDACGRNADGKFLISGRGAHTNQ